MTTFLQRSLSVLLCILLVNSVSFAQEPNPDPKPTQEQPLDKTTVVKETPPKQDPSEFNKAITPTSVAGGTPAGQTPEASPESKFSNRFQDIPVNLFLGTPIIGFPIYTLTEPGGVSLPLNLSYNATGMKGHDVASWCGMNWNFNVPNISRVVRGLPDEGKLALDTDFTFIERKGFYQHGIKADNDIENDGQPDLFFLNINGQSYKFSFDNNKKAHFFPEADIQLSVTWTLRNGQSSAGYFSNWIAIMPDGTKYFFDGNAFDISLEIEANESINISLNNSNQYALAEGVFSTYYATKIETAFGHQTTLEYRPTQYSYARIAEQEAITNNCTFSGISKKINRVFVQSHVPYKFSNNTHVVEFNKDGWTIKNYYGYTYYELTNIYPSRKDVGIYSNTGLGDSCATARALHKITVYAKDDPTKLYEWKFRYDYNTGNDPSGVIPFGYSSSTVGSTHKKRFKLRSIEEPDGNKYTFKYFDDNFPLPSRFTQGIDHWGYLNGALGSNTMIGEDAFRVCANGQFGNRSATTDWSQYGTLTAISHNTGGSTLLEYENNIARNYTPIIGGSRIKKVSFVDSISNLKTVKKYDYKQINGQSSGFLCLKPVYHFENKINYIGLRNQYWFSGLYQQLIAENGRPAVGYSRVRETIVSSDESDTLGYTISEFLQPLTEIKVIEKVVDESSCVTTFPPNLPPVTVCDTTLYSRPWKWASYHQNNVGVPSRVAVYGKANQLLSEKKSVYSEDQLQGTSFPFQQNYHSFRLVGENYNFESNYFETFTTYRQTSDTTKIYSQDGTNPVVNYSSQEYPLGGKHNQVIKTLTTDSYGNTIENAVKYAPDFDFKFNLLTVTITVNNPSNPEAKGIRRLQQKHIFNAPIESISRRKSFFGNTFVVNASYQTYYGTDSVGVQAGMPKSSFALENVPRSSLTEVSYTANNDTYVRSNDYDLKATVESYTSIGLPQQTQARFSTKSRVNYDATYTTLPINQISNVGESSQQTTSVEYAKILYGTSKQVGVSNLELRSEYYADGKLKQVLDKDGKVLKHLQYVYRGQADADPLLTTNTDYNRIITRIPRIATTTPLTLTHVDCAISITYMDGSGRVIEQIGYRASPNEKDMVSGVVEYDKFSRPTKSWLSVESTQNTGGLLDTATVKSIARAFYKDTKPYTEVLEYENSPLSRVFKSYGAGKVWRDSLKYAQSSYETATGIKRFRVQYDNNIIGQGTYSTYELTKMTSIDERGSSVIEYKDKTGNTIQKDVQSGANTYLSTIYIFDEANRLRYLLSPKAVNALPTETFEMETWAEFNENVYAYHYDGRGRVFESKKPGIGWEKTVFNRLNQAVMSQDSDELAKNNTWNYVQMDGQNRMIRSGQMVLPAYYTRDSLQRMFNSFVDANQFEERSTTQGSVQGYTNRSFPTALRTYVTDASLKSVMFYDDYSWVYSDSNSGSASAYNFQTNPFNASAYSATNAKGLMTGSLHKIDNFGNFWFPSTVYYDDKNRSIQSISYQDLYARNQSDIQYNFVGETLQSRMIYRKSGASDYTRLSEQTYDHVGRLKDSYYTLTEGTTAKVPRLLMSSLLYDNIGRIKTKFILPQANLKVSKNSGNWTTTNIWQNNTIPSTNSYVVISKGDTVTIPANTTVTAATLFDAGLLKFLSNAKLQMSNLGNSGKPALQSIDYSYNVRGQMRGINLDANDNPQTSADKLFSYRLDYHEDGRYFDGSISKMTWKSSVTTSGVSAGTKSTTYYYDRAGRLTSAISGASEENFSIPRVSYDANGNITFLSRMAKVPNSSGFLTTKVDSLDYQYFNGGNKLKSVTDNAIRATLGGFKNGTNSGDDYAYYADGKLQKDLNRNISLIEYNYLDLVSKVKFVNNDSIQYFYTTTGEKRRTERTLSGQKSYTFYDGEMVYTATGNLTGLNDYRLSEIQNSEGRYVNGKLEYGYTDHLGNLRLSYKDSLGTAFVTQGYAYDAWGLELKLHRYQFSNTNNDRYTWQGKEDLEADNLEGWSDFGWRIEDRTLGRWFTPDPEDQFESISSYSYCANNPVMKIDPDGRFLHIVIGAAIGGVINLGIKAYQGKITNWKDGAAAFGIGALAGGVGAATGGAAFLAAGGGAAGAGGFVAGAIGGVAGSAVSSPIQGFGNAAYFGDSYSLGDYGRDLLIGGVLGGAINGGLAGFKGKNFWNGDMKASGYGAFSFNNSRGLTEQNWTKLDNGKWFRGGNGDLTFTGTDLNGEWGPAWGKNLGDTYYKNLVDQTTARLNLYPRVLDPRTGRLIPLPSSRPAIPQNLRVDWNKQLRGDYIREYMRRGYLEPTGGWAEYDIHHILPRQYGGTNDFGNLVPVLRSTHQNEFNNFWKFFGQ
jgi:RHS repeat-associated protein